MLTTRNDDVDDAATAGYEYAAGKRSIPVLHDQLMIDSFNMGITQHNDRHGTKVRKVLESTREQRHDNTIGRSDKELAIMSGQ